jgi:hypothetical protein
MITRRVLPPLVMVDDLEAAYTPNKAAGRKSRPARGRFVSPSLLLRKHWTVSSGLGKMVFGRKPQAIHSPYRKAGVR